jgi:hypothetical protein
VAYAHAQGLVPSAWRSSVGNFVAAATDGANLFAVEGQGDVLGVLRRISPSGQVTFLASLQIYAESIAVDRQADGYVYIVGSPEKPIVPRIDPHPMQIVRIPKAGGEAQPLADLGKWLWIYDMIQDGEQLYLTVPPGLTFLSVDVRTGKSQSLGLEGSYSPEGFVVGASDLFAVVVNEEDRKGALVTLPKDGSPGRILDADAVDWVRPALAADGTLYYVKVGPEDAYPNAHRLLVAREPGATSSKTVYEVHHEIHDLSADATGIYLSVVGPGLNRVLRFSPGGGHFSLPFTGDWVDPVTKAWAAPPTIIPGGTGAVYIDLGGQQIVRAPIFD